MAVFAIARRTHSGLRSRNPWHIAVAVLLAGMLAIAGTFVLSNASQKPLLAETSSVISDATVNLSLSTESIVTRRAPSISIYPDSGVDDGAFAIEIGGGNTLLVQDVSSWPFAAAEPEAAPEATSTSPAAENQRAPALSNVQAIPISPVERWAAAGIVIVTDGQTLDDASLANVDAALGVLPSSLLASLGNRSLGPLYILVNKEGRTRSGDQPYRGPANFFSTNEKTNELVLYPQQSVFTVVHELGHAYNLRHTPAGRYALVLLDPEMRSFLGAVGWQVTSTDAEIRSAIDHMHVAYTYTGSFHWPRVSNDDPLEDFANSFAMYFLDPQGLQLLSPERFVWMAGTFGD